MSWDQLKLRRLAAYIIHDHGTAIAGIEDTDETFLAVAATSFTTSETESLTDDHLGEVREMVRRASVTIDGEVFEGYM